MRSGPGDGRAGSSRLFRFLNATYSYDALNRLTFTGFGTQAGPSYESTIGNTYDLGNRLTQTVDSISGTITPGFDGMDRLTSVTTPQGSVSYSYDAAGRRATMTVAGQAAVNYGFDNADRLTQISQGTSNVGLGYDAAGRRTSLILPNGVVQSYSYDMASDLIGINYQLGFNNLGTLAYSYDQAGRSAQVTGSFARTGLPLPVSTSAYNANNQLTQWGTAGLTYDANGNMLSDGTNSFTWDARNQLASMNFGANAFQYDPFGRRVAKTVSGTTTNYLYDGVNVAQELVGGSPSANLLTGGVDENFTRTDAAGARNFLTDPLGSTIALTDSAGTTQAQYTYEPFGNTTVTGSSTNSYQYTGRENDGTGLYFYRARYYEPQIGRFISEDPIRFSGGINFYAYVGNNPTSRIDPFGLAWPDELLKKASDFSAGAGSVLSFGLTDVINNATGASSVVDKCSGWHMAGSVAGIALTTAIGGAAGAEAAEANAGEKGFEFSHWIPERMGGPRSIFNGNFVSDKFAYLTDFYRYPPPAGAALRWGPKLNPALQQILRIPWVYDGAAAGAAYGAGGAMAGRNCGCQ